MGRLMRRRSTTTTDDAAPAPAPEPETAAERRCCRLRDAALSRNVRVRFLFDEIAKLGCDVRATDVGRHVGRLARNLAANGASATAIPANLTTV